jgi:hypothetical protein
MIAGKTLGCLFTQISPRYCFNVREARSVFASSIVRACKRQWAASIAPSVISAALDDPNSSPHSFCITDMSFPVAIRNSVFFRDMILGNFVEKDIDEMPLAKICNIRNVGSDGVQCPVMNLPFRSPPEMGVPGVPARSSIVAGAKFAHLLSGQGGAQRGDH